MNFTLLRDVSLSSYNTLHLNATAAIMAYPHNETGLCELMDKRNDFQKMIIVGRGSNIVFSESHYEEDYLFVSLRFLDQICVNGLNITAEAGASLQTVVWTGVENNITGLEFLEDIPGTIGGAIVMNAGTFQNTIGSLISSVRYYDIALKDIVDRATTNEDFRKRSSFWNSEDTVVLSCCIRGETGDPIEAIARIAEAKKERFRKQPREFPNAGSVFMRPNNGPDGIRPWQMLDSVGLRGFVRNGAAFSRKHPGFIVNIGNATFSDVNYLIELAKERVFEKYGVQLDLEWKIV